jgi:cephalosporin-C deacetylase-like acetyl esterase
MDFRSNPKYQGFDLTQATYKKVGYHEIETTILVPQTPYTGKRPTIIRIHGGGLAREIGLPVVSSQTLTKYR